MEISPEPVELQPYQRAFLSQLSTVSSKDDLRRHLTDALAVLLREPSLTIDAATLKMLARRKAKTPVVRDEKGRWRKA